ncbi:hypothetical protein [Zestomonas carbonaria]|uniref:Uncharacterized protein n=1 Tax=Zestomonas carbonaria TaxID=2762745 RepID=A0A7U7ENV7_9GAMM|nr:hypothetical protein [Pseudomonas carbonaria]CAD5108375.1 hypothetical protein PSEWESI4_02660 [Pseudomonas carbonaria]
MSDHLATLARRALQPARIRPRGQSRFESDALAPLGPELAHEQPGVPLEPVVAQPVVMPRPDMPAPLEPLLPTPRQAEPPPFARSREPAPAPPVPTPLREPVRAEPPLPQAAVPTREPLPPPPAERQPEPRLEWVERLHSEREVHERVELRQERLESRETLQEVLERRIERLVPLDMPTPPQAAPVPGIAPGPAAARAEPPRMAAPKVEISIGRIEVLPLEGTAAPRRDEAPRRQAAQSLDDYLRERGGRK